MVKNELAKKVDQIQSRAYEILKGRGYRKRGRTLNRVLGSGLVHVINFQMGRSFQALYGRFAVNLGVFIPEVHTTITGQDTPEFIQEYDCEIRQRLGCLLTPSGEDVWWDLALDTEELSAAVLDSLTEHGLPYLGRFLTRDSIIQEWKEHGRDIGLPPRAGLSIAIVLASQGQVDQAKHLLQQEHECARNKHYSALVKDVAQKMGTTVLG
jgi:hypothetical protein